MVRLSVFDDTWNAIRAREVRLDDAGEHVHRRALRRQHEMDADGARHLRQRAIGSSHLRPHRKHEVGQLVDEDHDVRQLGQGLAVLPGGRARAVDLSLKPLDVARPARASRR
jgi:hypothetical protein